MNSTTVVEQIDVKLIKPNPVLRMPKADAVTAMAASLSAIGQLSPVGVIRCGDAFKAIFGNTRTLAAIELGWQTIAAQIFPPETKPEECLRIAISENNVREQLTFVELNDAIHEYAKLRNILLAKAGQELNFKQPQVSKCLKINERVTPRNKKKLAEAGFGLSVVYLVSLETKTQDQLVDAVIEEKWTRKQLEQYFRQKRQGGTKFEFRGDGGKLVVDVPRTSTPEMIIALLKDFAAELKRCQNLNLATAARVIKEQSNAIS